MINNKQFIIMKKPLQDNGFTCYKLQHGNYLSVQNNLNIKTKFSDSGVLLFALLGNAFQCDASRQSPYEELLQISSEKDIPMITESWSGRWLLLYNETLYPDACGLLGCYYTDSVISSSLTLIVEQLHCKTKKPKMKKQFGLDFYPGPNTPYKDILHLFPGQTINVADHTIKTIPLLSDIKKYANDEERTEDFVKNFQTLLVNFSNTYEGTIKLPLTGGYDSRTLMALLEYSHIPYSTFTLEHQDISDEDIKLPPLIAKQFNKKHEYIKRTGKPDTDKYKIYDKHSGYMVIDEDRNFFAYNQYPVETQKTAILRAGIWECAREYFRNIGNGTELEDYKKAFVNIRHRTDLQESINAWLSYARSNPQNINHINRFYWDQRAGCWLSNVEQSLDVIDNMDSFQLCNCKRLLSILLDYDYETRFNKQHQIAIIKRTCPELLEFGFPGDQNHTDKKVPFLKKFKHKINTFFTCLYCLGIKETIKVILTGE